MLDRNINIIVVVTSDMEKTWKIGQIPVFVLIALLKISGKFKICEVLIKQKKKKLHMLSVFFFYLFDSLAIVVMNSNVLLTTLRKKMYKT